MFINTLWSIFDFRALFKSLLHFHRMFEWRSTQIQRIVASSVYSVFFFLLLIFLVYSFHLIILFHTLFLAIIHCVKLENDARDCCSVKSSSGIIFERVSETCTLYTVLMRGKTSNESRWFNSCAIGLNWTWWILAHRPSTLVA